MSEQSIVPRNVPKISHRFAVVWLCRQDTCWHCCTRHTTLNGQPVIEHVFERPELAERFRDELASKYPDEQFRVYPGLHANS